MKVVRRESRSEAGIRVRRRLGALTMVELVIVVAVLAVLALMILPPRLTPRQRPHRIHCLNDLKMVGLSFRIFATDHEDRFPPAVSTNEGGAKELVNVDPGGAADPTRTFWLFATLSNELATPKTVICPTDRARTAISNFHGMAYATPLSQGGQNASVSYFVNLDASEFTPQAILSGDRNLSTVTNAKRATDYDAFFSVERRIGPEDVKPGGAYAGLEHHPSLHFDRKQGVRQGNLLLADGSVRPANGLKVRQQILASTNVHRLVFPYVAGRNE
jgi:competence protein ComGC